MGFAALNPSYDAAPALRFAPCGLHSGARASCPRSRTPMHYTPLIVELLRSQPRLAFWAATLTQGALWWAAASLFYSSPPGELPLVLAIGHEFQLGSSFGPPLAFWMAEIAFRIAGAPGVYLLAQACVVIAYYGVFTLARAIVGMHHAAFAALLMAGIFAFTAPTLDFGPAVLAMPFTAFALVNLWRAVAERRRAGWFLLALQLGLLLLTTYAGLILVFAICLFLAATRRGRRALRSAEPWLASIVIVAVLFPHLIWLDLASERFPLALGLPRVSGSYPSNLLGFVALLILAHAGLIVLVALASKWPFGAQEKVPVFARSFTDPFGRRFVYFFALVPALAAALLASFSGERHTPGSLAPYLALSGLAVVVWAGNSIHWHRPRITAAAWSLLLAAPPLGVGAAIVVLPWFGVPGSAAVDRPAAAMGRFFAESFERRTGAPLAIVAGEPRTAALVALGAPTRPSLYLDATPERTPWVTADDVRRKGVVVVWPNDDTRAQAPADIAMRFPGLVADVPRAFERAIQGRLPLLRIGWGVIRPQADAARGPPDAAQSK
ncbi:MAG TPA: glycosyltransferase family 39 protein [Xanthobacteraceae bacterium]|nr:glycosyltransferase family 39 protein [Xanthobacteraceae bacterium]